MKQLITTILIAVAFTSAAKFMNSSVIMGIPLSYINVYSVRWNPASRTLEILTSLTVNVTYENNPAASTVLQRSCSDNKEVDSPDLSNEFSDILLASVIPRIPSRRM